jgi:ABC-type polysaccharide/polyol phosphate export permease
VTRSPDRIEATSSMALRNALKDIGYGLHAIPEATFLALWDIRLRYRRSVLGPLWISLTSMAFILGYYMVGTFVFLGNRSNYLVFVASGVIFWQLIVSTLIESSNLFTSKKSQLLSYQSNKTIFIIRLISKQVIILGHQLPIVFVFAFIFDSLSWKMALFLVFIPFVMFSSVGLIYVISIIGARFRDIPEFLILFFQLMFFVTPVIWQPSVVSHSAVGRWLLYLNPFFHFLEVLRAPLLGEFPTMASLSATFFIGIVSAIVGFFMFAKFRHRIAYWI